MLTKHKVIRSQPRYLQLGCLWQEKKKKKVPHICKCIQIYNSLNYFHIAQYISVTPPDPLTVILIFSTRPHALRFLQLFRGLDGSVGIQLGLLHLKTGTILRLQEFKQPSKLPELHKQAPESHTWLVMPDEKNSRSQEHCVARSK